MADDDDRSLENLQILHADLLALSESRLLNIERLGNELELHIEAFKALLDKNSRNEQSRKTLETGQINIRGDDYNLNDEFKQGTLQVADDLDLDELDTAKIFLEAQAESEIFGRSVLTCAVIRFHQQRKELLDCLRLTFQLYADIDQEVFDRDVLREYIARIIQPRDSSNASRFVSRCLSSMKDIQRWLGNLAARSERLEVVGQAPNNEDAERLEYQRVSLIKQHEALAVIVYYLSKNHAVVADFHGVLATLQPMDRLDNLLLHYFPAISSFISQFGGQDGGTSMDEAKALNEKLMGDANQTPWTLTYVHAAIRS